MTDPLGPGDAAGVLTAPPPVGRGVAPLTIGRVVEQGTLGLVTLLLAARSSLAEYATVGVVLVVNSLAVALSDQGLGFEALRVAPGARLARSRLTGLRRRNLAAVAVAAAVAALLGGEAGLLVAGAAVVWATSAEAFVRKSAAIHQGRSSSVMVAEVIGSAVLLAIVVVAARRDQGAEVLVLALIAKHALEAWAVRGWRTLFHDQGTRGHSTDLWILSVVNFLAANVDYVVVGAVLGGERFALYVLAFRVSSVLPAQLANVTSRTAVRDLAGAGRAGRVQVFDRYTTRLLQAGAVGGLLSVAAALVLPSIIGGRWDDVPLLVAVLAAGVPWRMAIGSAGALLIAEHRVRAQIVAQGLQAAGTGLLVAVGAAVGLIPATLGASLAAIAATLALQHLAAGPQGARRYVLPAVASAVVAVLVAVGAG